MGKKIPHIFLLIGQRAAAIGARYRHELQPEQIAVTILAAHERRPLRLKEFLEADDGNFAHDAFGIIQHFDVATGQMRNSFSPRFTERSAA